MKSLSNNIKSEKIKHLHNLIKGMNLPGFRKTTETIEGFRWLLKNIEVKNVNHPKYEEAKKVLVDILKENNCIKGE